MNTPLPAAPTAMTEKDDPTIWRADDALWRLLEPILRSDKPRKKPGRPRRDDRAIFDGLIWLARTGSQWSRLPREFGPKSTVHERFSEWVATGKLERAWAVLLRAYDEDVGLDCWIGRGRLRMGVSSRRRSAKRGPGEAQATGRNPTDRGKPGTKRHLLTAGGGLPAATVLSGANPPRHEKAGRVAGRHRGRADADRTAPLGVGPGLRLRRLPGHGSGAGLYGAHPAQDE